MQEWTIDMTGQLSPAKRAAFWKNKRVFFVTPQVLEKDIQSGDSLSYFIQYDTLFFFTAFLLFYFPPNSFFCHHIKRSIVFIGKCLVKHLVCLVIDEAHRAMGNYSYCAAVREV